MCRCVSASSVLSDEAAEDEDRITTFHFKSNNAVFVIIIYYLTYYF